jgi:hypothetical protein
MRATKELDTGWNWFMIRSTPTTRAGLNSVTHKRHPVALETELFPTRVDENGGVELGVVADDMVKLTTPERSGIPSFLYAPTENPS